MPERTNQHADLLRELWVFETRQDGIYVLVEEIAAQGELGPFSDVSTARAALVAYLRDELPEPTSELRNAGRSAT